MDISHISLCNGYPIIEDFTRLGGEGKFGNKGDRKYVRNIAAYDYRNKPKEYLITKEVIDVGYYKDPRKKKAN